MSYSGSLKIVTHPHKIWHNNLQSIMKKNYCTDQIETSTSPPPPLPGKPQAFDLLLCPGRVGNLTFTWVGWGKLNQKCQASSDFLFRAPKSLIAVNACLDEMEEFKGRYRTFVSDWLTKKGLQKLLSAFKACMKSRECLNIDDFRL